MAGPDAEKALKIIQDYVTRIKKLFETLRRFATQIVSTLKPVLDALKKLMSKIGAVASYLPSAVANTIKKNLALFKKVVNEMPRQIKQMQKLIVQLVKTVSKGVASIAKRDMDFIKNLLQALKAGFTQFFINILRSLLDAMKYMTTALKSIEKVESMIEAIIGDIGDMTKKIASALPLVTVIRKAEKAVKEITKYIGETEKNLKGSGRTITEALG